MYFLQTNIFSFITALLLHLAVLSGFFIYFADIPSNVKPGSTDITTPINSYLHEQYEQLEVDKANIEETKPPLPLEDLTANMIDKDTTVDQAKTPQKSATNSKPRKTQSAQNNGEKVATLVGLLHAAIQRKQQYPASAVQMGREGRIKLAFKLHPKGSITDLRIMKRSGTKSLDTAALAAVRLVTPFTEADKYLTSPQNFSIDVVFELDNR